MLWLSTGQELGHGRALEGGLGHFGSDAFRGQSARAELRSLLSEAAAFTAEQCVPRVAHAGKGGLVPHPPWLQLLLGWRSACLHRRGRASILPLGCGALPPMPRFLLACTVPQQSESSFDIPSLQLAGCPAALPHSRSMPHHPLRTQGEGGTMMNGRAGKGATPVQLGAAAIARCLVLLLHISLQLFHVDVNV